MTRKTSSLYKQESKHLFETSDLAETQGKYLVPKSKKKAKLKPTVKKEIIATSVTVDELIDEGEDTTQDPFASRLQDA